MRKMCTFHLHVLLTSLRSLPLSLPSFLSSPPGQHTWALGQMALEDQADLDRVANASVGSVLLHCLVCSCALSSLLLCSVEFALVLCLVCCLHAWELSQLQLLQQGVPGSRRRGVQ